MKRSIVFLVALLMAMPLFAQEENPDISKEVRSISNFAKLKVTKGINVTLTQGEEPEAEINIVNALPSDVIIENDKNELVIKMKTRLYKNVSVQVYLTYNDLREIKTGSGASIDNEGVLTGSHLLLDAGMDSSMDLKVDVETMEADVSAARITLEGYTQTLEAKATTGGKLEGQKLESQEAFVTANTGGVASVNVTQKLEAKAGTGGRVEYSGSPGSVDQRETLGGSVEEL